MQGPHHADRMAEGALDKNEYVSVVHLTSSALGGFNKPMGDMHTKGAMRRG